MVASNDRKNALPFAFLVVVVLVAIVAVRLSVGVISRSGDLYTSQELLEHTHLVLHEVAEAEDSLQDAREAALHYVLTPEQEDLINFDEAVRKTWVRLERISALTQDDKGYPERIEQLRGLIEKEFRQSEDNMRTKHTLLLFHSPEADANRDHVRAAMQKLKADEEEVLRERSEVARARAIEVERSISVVVGGFTSLVAALVLLLMRESKKLRIAGQNGSGAQSRLGGPLQQLQPESAAAAAAGDEKKQP